MAMSSWFSHLRCSSKCFFDSLALRTLVSRKLVRTQTTTNSESTRNPFLFWSRSLLPIALAVSAGSLALHPQSDPSLCEAPSVNYRAEFVVKGSHKEVPRELIDELKAICQDSMTLDYEERCNHGKPQNSFHKAVNIPDVVVFPRSEEQVSKIVKSCDKHKLPIVPYGGATSIEGHTLSPNGGVCIDMSLMNHVKALHVEDMDVVVEPGVGWMELNEYLEPYGLFFPLDPVPYWNDDEDDDGKVSTSTASSNQSFEFREDPSFWKDHNVQVIIRIRPLSSAEISVQGYGKCIRQESCQTITWTGHPESRFTFDIVADENVSQEQLFKVVGLAMVDNCMIGYNSCKVSKN